MISILTVVYNDKSIEDTIKSVVPFLNEDVEYIVVDGGSTDGTKEIIQKYKEYINTFISEPDNGIYDAMNKGVSLAKGKFIFHLNAGDFLLNLPLHEIKQLNEDIVAISYPLYIDGNNIIKPTYNWKINYKSSIHHQGTFYRKEIVSYNLKYKTFADLDLNQRIYRAGMKVVTRNEPIVSNHLSGGISSNGSQRRELYSLIYQKSGLIYLFVSFLESFFNKIVRTVKKVCK